MSLFSLRAGVCSHLKQAKEILANAKSISQPGTYRVIRNSLLFIKSTNILLEKITVNLTKIGCSKLALTKLMTSSTLFPKKSMLAVKWTLIRPILDYGLFFLFYFFVSLWQGWAVEFETPCIKILNFVAVFIKRYNFNLTFLGFLISTSRNSGPSFLHLRDKFAPLNVYRHPMRDYERIMAPFVINAGVIRDQEPTRR